MTLGLAAVLLGALLIYAGIKGRSLQALLVGDSTKPSRAPAPATR
jgi:hypothetical protein